MKKARLFSDIGRLLSLSFIICHFSFSPVGAQTRYEQYIAQYKDIAIEQMLRWKVPASITLAQGLLESGAGQSTLATKGNNHFGIKCHGWKGATIYRDDDAPNECFRAYKTVYDSFEDHSKFLANGQRYQSLFKLKITDYKGWAKGLKAAGYATSPSYAQSLIDIIQKFSLHHYDKAKSYDKSMVQHAHDGTMDGLLMHTIYMYNKNYYLYAREGDTFQSIAKEIGISYKKLASYNERDKDDPLEPGEVVWLEKKQKKAPKEFKYYQHVIKPGESLYSIAQLYGMQLKTLYKLNHITLDYSIAVGDRLRVR